MSRTRRVALWLVVQLLGWSGFIATVATNDGSSAKTRKHGTDLTLCIDAGQPSYKAGEPIPIKATLTNRTKKALAVEPRALFRYISFERLPEGEGDFGTGGQSIGDDFQHKSDGRNMVELAPGESLSQTIDVAPRLPSLFAEPGSYAVSLDYCYWGPRRVKGATARRGCIQSNEILLRIVPR